MSTNEYAYTFLEFALSIFIAIILLSISTPSLSRSLTTGEFKREISSLRNTLSKLSLEAGLRAITLHAVFEQRRLVLRSGDAAFLTKGYKPNTELDSNTPIEVTFFNGISASPTTISFKNRNDRCSLVISLRGRIRQSC